MHAFFDAALSLELQHNDRALELYQALSRSFPKSTYVRIQVRARQLCVSECKVRSSTIIPMSHFCELGSVSGVRRA